MTIAESVARIQERMENACARVGRNKSEVLLCAVSKFHSKEAVLSAYQCGVRLFGESRVQEAAEKFAGLKGKMEIHFIGNLQRNKAKTACGVFDCIQSLDRESLIDEIGVLTKERSEPLPVLLEMRTAEDTKAGFIDTDALCRAAEKALTYNGIALSGLMTMAPFTNDEKTIRESFKTLVSAKAFLETRLPGHWNCLSMGMSNDFEIAIEEGATLIRVGTAIFGERDG